MFTYVARRALTVAGLLAIVLTAAQAQNGSASGAGSLPAQGRFIAISAVGHATAEPDLAHLHTGVSAKGTTPEAALSATSAIIAKVIAKLKELGVEEKDIQTTNISVRKHVVYTNTGGPQHAVEDGYHAANEINVTVRDVSKLGMLLAAVTAEGANGNTSGSYYIGDPEKLRSAARANAMQNAKRKAQEYAKSLDAEIGDAMILIDDPAMLPGRNGMERDGDADLAEPATLAVPTERGVKTVTVKVYVWWALK